MSLAWVTASINGGGTVSQIEPAAATEGGIERLTLPDSSGDGLVRHLTGRVRLAPGMFWGVKLARPGARTSSTVWAGLWASTTGLPTATDGVGIRQAATGNIFGVCRSGSSETTRDLGIDLPTDGTYRHAGFLVEADGSVRFCTFDTADRRHWTPRFVGAAVETHIPAGSLYPVALAIHKTTGASRAVQVDAWALGGRSAR